MSVPPNALACCLTFRYASENFMARFVFLMFLFLLLACNQQPSSPVQPPAGSSVTLSTYVSLSPANMDWVAYQDGDGAWQKLEGTNGQYTFKVADSAGRYGIAMVCGKGAPYFELVQIVQATLKELPSLSRTCDNSAYSSGNDYLTGKVSGVAANEVSDVRYGPSLYRSSTPSADGSYLIGVINGLVVDIFAAKGPGVATPEIPTYTANKVIISRDVNLQGSATANFDFSSQGVQTEAHTVSLQGSLGSTTAVVFFGTKNGTYGVVGSDQKASISYGGVPPTYQLADELHLAVGITYASATGSDFRYAYRYFKSPVDITLAPPEQPFTASLTQIQPSNPSYVRFKIDWQNLPSAAAYRGIIQKYEVTGNRSWNIDITKSWLSNNTSPSYSLPDFSALPGWKNGWAHNNLGAINWRFSSVSSSKGSAILRTEDPVEAIFFNAGLAGIPSASWDGLDAQVAFTGGAITPQ